eukprot:7859785-Ditylum_brightwellii.AAC.1
MFVGVKLVERLSPHRAHFNPTGTGRFSVDNHSTIHRVFCIILQESIPSKGRMASMHATAAQSQRTEETVEVQVLDSLILANP